MTTKKEIKNLAELLLKTMGGCIAQEQWYSKMISPQYENERTAFFNKISGIKGFENCAEDVYNEMVSYLFD